MLLHLQCLERGCYNPMPNPMSSSGMWATRQMTKAEDREIYVRTTLRELVIYIIFLVILCIRELLVSRLRWGRLGGPFSFVIICAFRIVGCIWVYCRWLDFV